jgi:hypothetical protein
VRNKLKFRLLGITGASALLLAGMAIAGMPASSSTPSTASVGAALDPPSVATSTERCLQIEVPVEHYEEYQDILNAGDLLLAKNARGRDPDRGGFYFSEAKYQQVKSRLMELQNVPVKKGIVFSSYEDLEDKIDDIKPYVDVVGYNSELGMTPDEELNQMEDSLRRFAQLARSRDLAVTWGPTHVRLRAKPELLKLASEVDRIGLQHHNVLVYEGVEETVSLTIQRSLEIRELNPNIEIAIILKGDPKEIGDVLRQTVDYVDAVLILTKYRVPFDYQQLFDDVDLRSGCPGQPPPAAPTVPPTRVDTATPSPPPFQTPVPPPTPEPSGGIPIPCFCGIGSALLLLMAFWGWTVGRGN